MCANQCQPPAGDRLLHIRGNVLDYQRYCFFECKPAEGPSAPVSTQCIALDFKDVEKVANQGQARDPAIIYQAARHKASLVSAKKADPPTTQEAKMESLRGLKQSGFEGNEAFQEAKVTRMVEAKSAQKMNEMLREHLEHLESVEPGEEPKPPKFGATDPFAGIHDIR